MDKNKVNRALVGCLIILVAVFGCVLFLQLVSLFATPSREICSKKVCLQKFLDGPPAFNDHYMLNYLHENFMSFPGGKTLNITNINKIDEKNDVNYGATKDFINEYFKDRRDGRFVVLGAGDGEYRDYTLDLEVNNGWTGLLVESNPQLYKGLQSKGRNAEISSACVSPYSYPSKTQMKHPAINKDIINNDYEKYIRYRETKLAQLWEKNYLLEEFSVQCIPLTNILYAAQTIGDKIDLLVMDMAGSDMDVMASVSLDSLPQIEMLVLVGHGGDVAGDIGGFFLERNMVVSKTFGNHLHDTRYILTKFRADGNNV